MDFVKMSLQPEWMTVVFTGLKGITTLAGSAIAQCVGERKEHGLSKTPRKKRNMTIMSQLNNRVESLLSCTSKLEAQQEYAAKLLKETILKQRQFVRLESHLNDALLIAQEVAQLTQAELEYQISALVTNALASIFPEPYEFKVQFEIKRGKTEATLLFVKDGENIDPLTAAGGGVVDVAAFVLRLSAFLISTAKPPPCIILDEPFRFVSDEYQPAVAELLEEMALKLGIQFVIVTHEGNLKIGNVIEV